MLESQLPKNPWEMPFIKKQRKKQDHSKAPAWNHENADMK